MDKNINIDQKLIDYIFSHTNNLHPIQNELIKFNDKLGNIKRLQISVLQANFLQFLIKIKKIKSCLELGTFTGYSTLSMALSLPKNGKIHTIDKDFSKSQIVQTFFKKAKLFHKLKIEISKGNEALDRLVKIKKKYDLILIDADKENYINYFNQVSNKLSKNGIIISDNVLWSGKVLDSNQMDEETATLVQFNKIINDNKRFKSIILPIRDGISISRLV